MVLSVHTLTVYKWACLNDNKRKHFPSLFAVNGAIPLRSIWYNCFHVRKSGHQPTFKESSVDREGHLASHNFTSTIHSTSLFLMEMVPPCIFSIMSVSLTSLDISYLFLSCVYDLTFLNADLLLLTHSHSLVFFLFQPYAFALLPYFQLLLDYTVHCENACLSFRRYEV